MMFMGWLSARQALQNFSRLSCARLQDSPVRAQGRGQSRPAGGLRDSSLPSLLPQRDRNRSKLLLPGAVPSLPSRARPPWSPEASIGQCPSRAGLQPGTMGIPRKPCVQKCGTCQVGPLPLPLEIPQHSGRGPERLPSDRVHWDCVPSAFLARRKHGSFACSANPAGRLLEAGSAPGMRAT